MRSYFSCIRVIENVGLHTSHQKWNMFMYILMQSGRAMLGERANARKALVLDCLSHPLPFPTHACTSLDVLPKIEAASAIGYVCVHIECIHCVCECCPWLCAHSCLALGYLEWVFGLFAISHPNDAARSIVGPAFIHHMWKIVMYALCIGKWAMGKQQWNGENRKNYRTPHKRTWKPLSHIRRCVYTTSERVCRALDAIHLAPPSHARTSNEVQ